MRSILGPRAEDRRAQALLAEVGSHQPRARSLVGLIARMPFEWLRARRLIRGVRRLVPHRSGYSELRRTVQELVRLRGQMAFNRSLQRLLSGWRVFHVVLSILLVAVIAAHIGVSWYLGYRWVLR